ncbi:MAG: DinB family protein [Deinococcales bacterium]
MPLTVESAAARLAASVRVIQDLVTGVSVGQARWKPGPERWSILEVVNHLHDEEREDFRFRFRHLLERSPEPPPPIDPPRWVVERRYNERELGPSLESFVAERRVSLAWLASLERPDLEAASPVTGRSAGELLAAWVAHDLLHVRQITKLHYDYWAREVSPLRLEYAGEWR